MEISQWMIDLVTWFGSLFTPDEMKAMVWLIVGTLVFTHFVKVAWRRSKLRGGGDPLSIHLVAGLIGLLLAIPLWPADTVPWWIAGPVVGGGLSIAAFKMFYGLLRWRFPELARALNFDRRKEQMPLPPAGVPERRQL